MLRRLPVRDPDSLVYLTHGTRGDLEKTSVFSYPAFVCLRDAARGRVEVFATSVQSSPQQAVLPDAGGEEEKVRVQFVSGDTFRILGVTPHIGRLLSPADDVRPGGHPAAVLSHGFWKRRFRGDPQVLGRWLQVAQRPYQVIGVAREGFTGTEPGLFTDVWVPTMMWRPEALTSPNWGWLRVWGRILPALRREEVRPLLERAFLAVWLIQQVLVESGLVAAAASAIGILFAAAAAPLVVRMLGPAGSPAYLDLRIDWRFVAFVAALGGAATLLFGLAPALRASSVSPRDVLAAGGDRQSSRLGLLRLLVATQVAFSLMLLLIGGLLLLSFQRLLRLDLGFSKSGVVLLTVETRTTGETAKVSVEPLLENMRRMPGVEASAASAWALFRGWTWGSDVQLSGGRIASSFQLTVSPGFFEVMRIRILDGREFQARDFEADAPAAVIVNEMFARRYFPGRRAVGEVVESRSRGATHRASIVGVVANAKDNDVREPKPFLYWLHREAAGMLEVRLGTDPLELAPRLRTEVLRVHPSLRVTDVTLQSTLVDDTLLHERLLALLSGFFAAVGVLLAAVGLYGVLSYFVVRRTREIGIRMALGARHRAVVATVLGHIAAAVGVGIAGGLGGGLYIARFVAPLLFEVKPLDFWSLALPVAALLAAAALAAIPPARRAARVDPIVALRYE